MALRNFRQMLEAKWTEGNFVCVGLDSELEKIPKSAHRGDITDTITSFNRSIIVATKDIVCAYKPNIAFYEAHGTEGIKALHNTIMDIHILAPNVPVILDAKRADIGNTNNGYVKMAFDCLNVDAITVHPYLGAEALKPFLERVDKGVIVLCRTSNPGSGEFQDRVVTPTQEEKDRWGLSVLSDSPTHPMPLYQLVAHAVKHDWNKNGNCALVAGATYPDELKKIRRIVGDLPILIPGIGTQGGNVERTVTAGKDSRNKGMIINSSSGIIFASKESDFADAARRETTKLRDLINQYR